MAQEVVHMVWFKLKKPLAGDDLKNIRGKAHELKAIPGVVSVEVGENFTDRAKGFGLGLFVRLTNKDALSAYGPHPIHQGFITFITEYRDETMAMDFESPGANL